MSRALELLEQDDCWFDHQTRSAEMEAEPFVDAPGVMLAAALGLVRRGFAVFPLNYPVEKNGQLVCSCGNAACRSPAKHPIGKFAPQGVNSATVDPLMVQRWWTAEPAANIGLAAAIPALSGSPRVPKLVIIDIDPRNVAADDPDHNGDVSLWVLEMENNGPFDTWRALTGGGGQHVFFRPPDPFRFKRGAGIEMRELEIKNSKPLPGCDIKSAGGYVVAPPSRHISGRRYAWARGYHPNDKALAKFPTWLALELAYRSGTSERNADYRKIACEGANEGARTNSLVSFTGHLLAKGVEPSIVRELMHGWNQTRCRPPLDYEEVEKTVANITKRELMKMKAGS